MKEISRGQKLSIDKELSVKSLIKHQQSPIILSYQIDGSLLVDDLATWQGG